MKTTEAYKFWNDADLTLTTAVSSASDPAGSAVAKQANRIVATYAASASGDELQITAPFKFEITGIKNMATAAVAGATITVNNAGTAVGTVSSVADNTEYRAATISQDAKTVAKGAEVTLVANSDAVQGIVVIEIDPL